MRVGRSGQLTIWASALLCLVLLAACSPSASSLNATTVKPVGGNTFFSGWTLGTPEEGWTATTVSIGDPSAQLPLEEAGLIGLAAIGGDILLASGPTGSLIISDLNPGPDPSTLINGFAAAAGRTAVFSAGRAFARDVSIGRWTGGGVVHAAFGFKSSQRTCLAVVSAANDGAVNRILAALAAPSSVAP